MASVLYSNQLGFAYKKSKSITFLKNNINFSFQYLEKYSNENESEEDNDNKKQRLKDIKIFDKPDFSWFKEKNRMEKAFIAIGTVSCTIGFSMLLAGLINYLVPLNAVTIDGEPIKTAQNTYIALMGAGSGLIAAGIPFVVVGAVRLWLYKKKTSIENRENNQENDRE